MSAATTPVRVARFYTSARQLPWVIGKFSDWRIPLGPYNALQVAVMSLGGLALVKSASLWWPMAGPVPVIAWIVVIFLCRKHRIAGRTPLGGLLGVAARIAQPAGGRIGGRPARDRRPQVLSGTFTLQHLPSSTVAAAADSPAATTKRRTSSAKSAGRSEQASRVRSPRRPAERNTATRPATHEPAAASAGRRALSPVQAALLAAHNTKGDRT
ncbi:hypothetical protein G3I40_12160 [Streptomyces sp. SID14478]|uniref:hypothetical protein n=1 Tax=Streptomyces sp. SID14478 TaxID=2706073 RepID=UPI0013DB6FB0|nr:hypothetical protein [Streptomyces sp. SID14478]NEB75970.1 hypothetical protein [Streptomyces sp. SID14478]